MTALDTNLTILEGLDFAPPCDAYKGCDAVAKFAIHGHQTCCEELFARVSCPPHLSALLAWLQKDPQNCWVCLSCGSESKTQLLVIDRIEAL